VTDKTTDREVIHGDRTGCIAATKSRTAHQAQAARMTITIKEISLDSDGRQFVFEHTGSWPHTVAVLLVALVAFGHAFALRDDPSVVRLLRLFFAVDQRLSAAAPAIH
jgi:hypothetical protein